MKPFAMTDDTTFYLSIPEYLLLLAIVHAPIAFALDRDVVNRVAQVEMEAALATLQQRQYARRQVDGRLDITPPLLEALAVYAQPRHILSTTCRSLAGGTTLRLVHFGHGRITAESVSTNGQRWLRVLSTADEIVTSTVEQFGFTDRPAAAKEPFQVALGVVESWLMGATPAEGAAGWRAFVDLVGTVSVVARATLITHSSGQSTDCGKLVAVDAANGIYLLQTDTNRLEEVRVTPVDLSQLRDALTHLLHAVA